VVARFAEDAIKYSALAGQRERVVEALNYLNAAPTEFPGRAQIKAALEAADTDCSPALTHLTLPERADSLSEIDWNRGQSIPTAAHFQDTAAPTQ